jgi:hypothetical protein
MTHKLMKGIWKFTFASFLIWSKNLIRIHLNFYSSLLRVGLLTDLILDQELNKGD